MSKVNVLNTANIYDIVYTDPPWRQKKETQENVAQIKAKTLITQK